MTKAVKLTQIIITVNLLIASSIIIKMYGFRDLKGLVSDFILNFALGIAGLYLAGNFIGQKIDHQIKVRHTNAIITGIIGLFLILIFGIFAGSTVGFLKEGIAKNHADTIVESAVNYYVKPLFWILIFGFVPTIITGSILGILIKKAAAGPDA
jgi:hypothetical protein